MQKSSETKPSRVLGEVSETESSSSWEYVTTQHVVGQPFRAPVGFPNLNRSHVVQMGQHLYVVCLWSRWTGAKS